MLIRFIFLLIFTLNIVSIPTYSINWERLVSGANREVFLDKDSITQEEGFYFYNIKFINTHTNLPAIITMQTQISHPFSARIKSYTIDEYTSLNGDYINITKNKTKDLELVTYKSIVYACYNYINILYGKRPSIIISD